MNENRDKLVRFLRKQQERDAKPFLALRHGSSAGKGSPVSTWGSVEWGGMTAEEAASRVENAAQEDADGLQGGKQRYVLVAMDGERALERCTFTMLGDDDMDNDASSITSERADAGGFAAQAMKHNEVIMRIALSGFEATQRANLGTIHALARRNEQMEEKHIVLIQLTEDLLSQRAERELAQLAVVNKERRLDATFDKFALLLPAVANKLMGKNILPASTTPAEEQIVAFMESMTPQQFEAMTKVFRPEQQVAMMSMYETARERREAQIAEKADAQKKAGANLTSIAGGKP